MKKPGPHRYQKGNPKKGGRKVGSTNKLPRLLKEAILMAAELEGSNQHGKDKLVGFLRHVAREELPSFCSLLGRVLPLQIEEYRDVVEDVTYRSVAEVSRELASRGIDMAVVAKILAHTPETIDADAITTSEEELR